MKFNRNGTSEKSEANPSDGRRPCRPCVVLDGVANFPRCAIEVGHHPAGYSHKQQFGPYCGVWVLDWLSRQGYKVCVIRASCGAENRAQSKLLQGTYVRFLRFMTM